MSIPRIIFNFNDRCINGCKFCFIPFDKKGTGELYLWSRIIERAYSFSPELISFSGCDPLMYPDFYRLLETVPKRSKWAVDTSLVYLDRTLFERIYQKIDLISTSIDDVPQMKVRQRYDDDKLRRFFDNFKYVTEKCPNIMAHTLYSRENSEYLPSIADRLISQGVKHWSLYQFWPFDFMGEGAYDFMTDDGEFEKMGRAVAEYCGDRIDFEAVPYKGRANGYFFVSSLGTVYTVLSGDMGRYLTIGSIFDDDIEEKWRQTSSPERAGKILQMKLNREGK